MILGVDVVGMYVGLKETPNISKASNVDNALGNVLDGFHTVKAFGCVPEAQCLPEHSLLSRIS